MIVNVIDQAGENHALEALEGWRVMEVIRDWGLNIKAECGGAMACATCHVYVDEAWREATGKPSAMEESMLDFAEEVEPNSRLSCQIRVSDALDGLIVRLPENQH